MRKTVISLRIDKELRDRAQSVVDTAKIETNLASVLRQALKLGLSQLERMK